MSMLRTLASCMSLRRLLLAVAYLLVLVSCDAPLSPDEALVGAIEATPASLSMEVGVAQNLTARVVGASGATLPGARLHWSAENPAVATVSQTGNVVAVAPGATRVAVSSRGISTIVPVTVAERPVSVVRVTPASTTVRAGSSVAFRADALNSAGDTVQGKPVLWTSTNEAVATVSSSGIATGVSSGIATISASVDGVSGSALLMVAAIPVASVRVQPSNGALFVGQSLQLTAVTEDSAGKALTGRLVTWASSDPTVVTVSSTGIVHALASGSATITARSEGQSGTSVITASLRPVDAVTVTPGSATMAIGQRVQLTATVVDSSGSQLSGRAVAWTSDQPTIASVAQDGMVTGVATGRATITATSEGKSGKATIDVTPVPVASLTVTPATATLPVGGTQLLTAVARDAQGVELPGRVVTWLSGAPSLATVSQGGLVTAVGEGLALIIATCEGQRATVNLAVVQPVVTSVSVSPASVALNPDSSRQFTAVARDALGNAITGRTTSWASSNPSVATVSASGVVTALGVGTTQVSATVGGVAGAASVTVSLIPVARVAMSASTLTLIESVTSTLTAVATDSLGGVLNGRALTWSSDNPAVASVSQGGVVTAIVPGTATVSATAPNAGVGGTSPSGATVVTVSYAPVTGVSVTPSTPSIFVGASVQLTAALSGAPLFATLPTTGRILRWSVADVSVATVSSSGVVTGIAPGTTTVTLSASSPGQTSPATATVSVTVKLVPIASVALSPIAGTIHVGTLYGRQVVAQPLDSAGNVLTGRPIAWSTSDANRLAVTPAPSNPGAATLVAAGAPATGLLVVATAAGPSGPVSDTLTISSDLVSIAAVTVSPAGATLLPSEVLQLTAIASDSAGNTIGTSAGNPLGGRPATWSSADPSVGTVSATGLVTAVGLGNATVNVSVGGAGPGRFSLTVALTKVATVGITASDSSIFEGQTVQATAVARDLYSNVVSLVGRAVAWSSSIPSIATVSPSGLLTAARAGATTVGVTIDGVGPATFALSVAQVPVDTIESVPRASAPSISISAGAGKNAKEKFRLLDANGGVLVGRSFTLASGDPSLGTIAPVGSTTTDSKGEAEFVVTLTSAARVRDTFNVVVSAGGKSTVWIVTVK